MEAEDEWICAYNVLPPASPTGLNARDAFDAEVFAQDAYLDDQWQRTLQAEAPPWRFELAPRDIAVSFPTDAAAAPLPTVAPAAVPPPPPLLAAPLPTVAPAAVAPPPPPLGARRLTECPLMGFTVFVKEMLRSENSMSRTPVYFSLGEVAQYFNHFTVDVLCHGPFTCRQVAAMRGVPEAHLYNLWTFRPGPQSFTRKQVAARLGMSVNEVTRAYAALGFGAWVL